MIKGRVASIETMGLVDGPGIRVVVFFAGCGIRCSFCHNPENWDMGCGEVYSATELFSKILRFKPYFEKSGGGVTFSGGEPLLQPEFLRELLLLCREAGIHTCLDTAGVGHGGYYEILSLCDLVLYDVKATSAEGYLSITGADIQKTEEFTKALREIGTPTVVRQVVIPGINDTDEYMVGLARYTKEKIPTAYKVELLPYHTLGSHKYKKLGIPEPLSGLSPMDEERCEGLWQRHFADFTSENF